MTSKWWPDRWAGLSVDARRDDLLANMLGMAPAQHKSFVGKSVRIPRPAIKKKENPAPQGFQIPEGSLLDRINKVVPRMRAEWRDDVIQDIALAIINKEVSEMVLEDIDQLAKFRSRVLSMYADRWKFVSLEKPLYEENWKTLRDLLVDEGETPEEIVQFDMEHSEFLAEMDAYEAEHQPSPWLKSALRDGYYQ